MLCYRLILEHNMNTANDMDAIVVNLISIFTILLSQVRFDDSTAINAVSSIR